MNAQMDLPTTVPADAELLWMLKSPNFAELRNWPEPVYGEPEGPTQQRKVVRWVPQYMLAWKVAEGYVRWVHAPTLAELPALVAAGAWR